MESRGRCKDVQAARANPDPWSYWLPRRRLRTITLAIIAVSGLIWTTLLFSSRGARTPLGTELGGDFPGFYSAGVILLHDGQRLYDLTLQWQLYHRLLPDEP